MDWRTILGLAAASATTFAFFPQVMKSWKTGQTKDISLPMYCLMTSGVALWLLYGIFIHDLPIIMANAITLLFTLSILFLKIKNG